MLSLAKIDDSWRRIWASRFQLERDCQLAIAFLAVSLLKRFTAGAAFSFIHFSLITNFCGADKKVSGSCFILITKKTNSDFFYCCELLKRNHKKTKNQNFLLFCSKF